MLARLGAWITIARPTAAVSDDPKFFATPDAWGYQTNPEDAKRKQYILRVLKLFPYFSRALDIGAHEGWITKDLPAATKHGFEVSDLAAARFPQNVARELHGFYDLVVATGVLYSHYDAREFVKIINARATDIVLTCSIREWEDQLAVGSIMGKQILSMEFPYREYTQKLRVFQR